jgi:hypothetical protein
MHASARLLGAGLAAALAPVAFSAAVAAQDAAPTAPPVPPKAGARPVFDDPNAPKAYTKEATTPETFDGKASRTTEAAALEASLADCDDFRHCAWTGGGYTGPAINFYAGASYNWGNYHEDVCDVSGTDGPIWKNCASSLRNRNAYYTARYYTSPNGTGDHLTEAPYGYHSSLYGFNNNIESSTSSLY